MPGPFDDTFGTRGWPTEAPPNPRTYPARPLAVVEHETARFNAQADELEATMAATGQTGALVIARVGVLRTSATTGCSVATWAEGPATVLPRPDVLALFELPATVDGAPRQTWVRWDVAARICGSTCWRVIDGLAPQRVITSTWPTPDQLSVLRALSLPEPT